MRIKRVLGHTKRAVKRVVSVLSPLSLKSYGGSQIFIFPPQRRLEFPGGGGGSVWPNNLKKGLKRNWNFQKGGGWGVLEKIPSMGEVCIFSGITQCSIGSIPHLHDTAR